MEILLSNNHLEMPGGSEVWTVTMAEAFRELGHDVTVYSYNKIKRFSKKSRYVKFLRKEYCLKIHSNLAKCIKPDVVFANHNTTVDAIRAKWTDVRIIQTVHGTIPNLEQPSSNANSFFCVSEEIRLYLKEKGIDAKVFNQPVHISCEELDLEAPKEVENVLSLCQDKEFNLKLKEALQVYPDVKFRYYDKFTNSKYDVSDDFKWCDGIIAIGRGVVEAFSHCKPVLVMDKRPYMGHVLADGVLTAENYESIKANNFSGRTYKRNDIEELLSSFVMRVHNIRFYASLQSKHSSREVAKAYLLEIANK